MITKNSTLREVYRTPAGKDVIDMVLASAGRSPKLLDNPLVGSMRLSALDKLLGHKIPGAADMLVKLLGNRNEKVPPSPLHIPRKWWKEAVVYQIYPRSFQDSNGDGIGDLAGIRQRIPYLKELGVDVVWLSPIYDSPNDDMGYDIRNYRKIMKEFGTMRDFNSLLADLHKNGIKLMMDLVVNHTSDEHEWFKKALADPTGPYKDYYLWANGKGDAEPNNWTSFFGGPAWNYYTETGEWALHLFSKKQMDLNWENPEVRREVYEMMDRWMDKGVDGFRMDVINLISKGSLADGNELVGDAFGIQGIEHYFYGPRLHEYLKEMRQESFGKYDAFTVGETPGVGMEMSKMLTAEERAELDLVFNFDHLDTPGNSRKEAYEYDLRYLKPYFLKWQLEYGNNCWPSLFFENHDNPRMISKVNPDPAWRRVIGKLLAVMQLTMKGTPFIYQGQELGMTNCLFEDASEFRDVETINQYQKLLEETTPQQAFKAAAWGTRDHARTPMQWDATEFAGFSTAQPWLKVNPNYPAINAKIETENQDSIFHFFQKLIALRKQSETMVYGEFKPVFTRDKNVLCYFRIGSGEKYYIEINLTNQDQKRPGPITGGHVLVAGNYGGVVGALRPYEANVFKV